jgi:hypothetical protein
MKTNKSKILFPISDSWFPIPTHYFPSPFPPLLLSHVVPLQKDARRSQKTKRCSVPNEFPRATSRGKKTEPQPGHHEMVPGQLCKKGGPSPAMRTAYRPEESDLRISIGTWEEGELVPVGFQIRSESGTRLERIDLSQDETGELLKHEEECSR